MKTDLTTLSQETSGYCQAILNGLGDQVLVINRDYIVTDVNEPMLRQTGLDREQIIGLPCYQVNHHLDTPCWMHDNHPCPAQKIWETRRPAQAMHTHFDANGKIIHVQVIASPLLNDNDEVIGFVETCHNVTAQNQLETQLDAIYKLGHELTLLHDEAMIVKQVLQTAVTLLQFEIVDLALVDEAANKLAYHYALENGSLETHEIHLPLDSEQSISAAVARSGQALNLLDTTQDPRFIASRIKTRSELCVPLKVKQRVIGVLNAESCEFNYFSITEERLLQTLADQAAFALENARLYTALRQSENRYALATSAGKTGVWDWDMESYQIHADTNLKAILGYAAHELQYDRLDDYAHLIQLVHKHDIKLLQKQFQAYLAGEKPHYEAAARILHKENGYRWILIRGIVVRNANNQPIRLTGTFTDITTSKEAEAQLRLQAKMLDSVREAVVAMSLTGHINYWGRGAERLYGYPAAEVMGQPITDFLDFPTDLLPLPPQLKETDFGQNQFRQRHRDGHYFWVDTAVSLITDQDGNPQGIISIGHDITEQKQAEEALRLNNTRLEALYTLSQMINEPEDAIKDFALEAGVLMTNSQIGYIYFMNEDETELILHAWSKNVMQECRIIKPKTVYKVENTGIWGEAVRQRKPIITNNYEAPHPLKKGYPEGHVPIQRHMNLPLIDNGKIVLIAGVGNKEDEYNESDVKQLTLTMDGMWRIVQKKKAEETLRQRNQELTLLNRAGQSLSATLELDKVLNIMLEETRHILQVASCSVWLVDTDTNDLVCHQVTDPLGASVQGWRLAPGQGFAGWAVEHGESIVISDALNDERHFKEVDEHTGITTRSIMAVPLRTRDEVIGVFQVVDGTVDRFKSHDLQLAKSLAAVAANTIENARLHADLKKQFEHLQKAQTQLLQSEKLAAIGELIAGVAHELNNPLTSITLYSQLLHRKGVNENIQKDLQVIVSQARRATSIVRSLLDFARQRPPERKSVQINNILQSSLELLAYELRSNNIEWITQLISDLPLTIADAHQLQQVFVNLINNAAQAMSSAHGGGRLTAVTQIGPSHYPGHTLKEEVIRIIVRDDGPGIPMAIQPRIFDPFFTTKSPGEGTGLGLSVCHGIISEHNGHIWMKSKPGQGTAFYIELPIIFAEQPLKSGETGLLRLESQETNMAHILVIDDEPSVRKIMSRALNQEGYRVDVVEDGELGLESLSQTSYDLVLCDIRMPKLNGLDFYQQVQNKHPHLTQRIIFITGDTLNLPTQHFLKEVKPPYLNKPFDLRDLKRIVQKTLNAGDNKSN